MTDSSHKTFFSGFRITSLMTLLSRLLGMLRDVATAWLFVASGSGVMDAFVMAFRIPDLFRRLFGEGALTASYLPVISERLENERRSAEQLASATLASFTVLICVIVVICEIACALLLARDQAEPVQAESVRLMLGFASALLPYVLFISLTAQLSATLHALNHFTAPAIASSLLNVGWLIGIGAAVYFADDEVTRAYVLIGSLLIAGVLQTVLQFAVLRCLDFRFRWDWAASRPHLRRIVIAMLPALLGLSITQINTLCDSVMAWTFSVGPNGPATISWLGDVAFPMKQGAAAATYYGERLYMFPLGLIGIATATVIFPLLSQHAARGRLDQLGRDLTTAVRLVLFLAVPASFGLFLLAEPIVRLLFQRGEFTAEDTFRTASMIRGYALGVWAFCVIPVVVRGYYALGDLRTPVCIGSLVITANMALNFWLMWQLSEAGLSLATSATAAIQVGLLVGFFSRAETQLALSELAKSALLITAGSIVMWGVGFMLLNWLSQAPSDSEWGRVLQVSVPLLGCVIVYLATARIFRSRELDELVRGMLNRKPGK
jgi:putative peptidoglycan lipid II flippase